MAHNSSPRLYLGQALQGQTLWQCPGSTDLILPVKKY